MDVNRRFLFKQSSLFIICFVLIYSVLAFSVRTNKNKEALVRKPGLVICDFGERGEEKELNPEGSVSTLDQSDPDFPAGFFTLGSTKAEVIRAQGEPVQKRHGVFRYTDSSVYFEGEQVVGWHRKSGTALNVALIPQHEYTSGSFTVGSTLEQVLAIEGTPDQYDYMGRELRYGKSRITFQNGKVENWELNAADSLKARLLPKHPSEADVFTLGSSKDDVLAVQGTPDHIGERSFIYGQSGVHFTNNRVSGWNEVEGYPLAVVLERSIPDTSAYFTLGSTRYEVIAIQGTPNQYSRHLLKYGYSTVSFVDDTVVSWYQSPAQPPLKVRAD